MKNFAKFVGLFVVLLFCLPFAAVGFTVGFLFRVMAHSFINGYAILSDQYFVELTEQINNLGENNEILCKDGQEATEHCNCGQ